MGIQGDFVVAVEPAAVVDPGVGAFNHPTARLDDEPVGGFRPGYYVNADPSLGGGIGNS